MNNTKFTPGPWFVKRQDDGSVAIVNSQGSIITYAFDISDNVDCDENASLIAAAPELYAALENMLAISGGVEHGSAVYDSSVAALKKARGEL